MTPSDLKKAFEELDCEPQGWEKQFEAIYKDVCRKPMSVLCPFHEEKTPSCCLDHANKMFRCLGCGAKGVILPDGKLVRSGEGRES